MQEDSVLPDPAAWRTSAFFLMCSPQAGQACAQMA